LAYRLAAKSGRPVSEILERFENENIAEWMAFDRIDAMGDARMLMQIATVAAMVGNANRSSNSQTIRPKDMMVVDLYYPPRDPKEMFDALASLAR
jgi:hypothetical protein